MSRNKVRATPRISINKLAEYLGATARRRKSIILDQKYPPDFKVAIYNEAQSAIVKYLVSESRDESIITKKIEELLAETPGTTWEVRKCMLCVDALEAFLHSADVLDHDGIKVKRAVVDAPDLEIGGVAVSVRPGLVLSRKGKNGEAKVGALKLAFSKSTPLDEAGAGYVGAAMTRYVSQNMTKFGKADADICLTLDVFAKQIYVSPKAVKAREADIAAACEEIARA